MREEDMDSKGSGSMIPATLKSQYHATLAMLRQAIEACPETLWHERMGPSAPWQIAYHALYFTHLYLQTHLDAFEPWEGHQTGIQHEDGFSGPTPDHVDPALPELPDPYTKAQVLAYWEHCDRMVDTWVDEMDLASPDSGFFWYRVSKLEHQLINLRHLAHHTGQLADRVRVGADHGIRWIGARPPR
jgi:hypothetical protein